MAFSKLIKTNELKEGGLCVVKTKYAPIVICKIGGEVFAFEDACSHDGEEISCGTLDADIITCPRHFAKFNVKTGAVVARPATEPLTTYKTRISGDDIEVDLED
ncbi:MAG: Rieske 2Fe-2S domain-containing protein [Leptospira sp.]|nr:Rieske 2Fe-2S domain-containing protein [Leptospira sp.]